MKEVLQQRLEQARLEGIFQSGIVGSVTAIGKRVICPVGTYETEGVAFEVHKDTLFDVASITKAIPVSSLALFLIDREELKLDMRVCQILPEFKTSFYDEITVRHLLTQTLDYRTPLAGLVHMKPEMIKEHILTTQFSSKPGEIMNYTNATSIVLGMIIESVSGARLDKFADETFFKPLGMTRTTFHPDRFPKQDIVPTENDPKRKRIIQGEVHDESASVLQSIMIPGSAGLFSTVPDLLTFMQMLIQKGEYQSKRYFSEAIIHEMATNQLDITTGISGLGWEIRRPQYMGSHVSPETIGKTGFTGCVVIGDILQGKAMVLLANYHYPKRKKSIDDLNCLRRDLANIIFHP